MLSRASMDDEGDGNAEIPTAQLHSPVSSHRSRGISSSVSIYALGHLPSLRDRSHLC